MKYYPVVKKNKITKFSDKWVRARNNYLEKGSPDPHTPNIACFLFS